jgi:deazaflavin-dependent oxidoreductase (nitroreductase family)
VAKGGKLRRVVLLGAGVAALNYGSALYERFLPYDRKRRFQQHFGNPFGRSVMRWFPGWALLETTGRRTGEPRRVPVGGRRIGESFWLVAADPREAGYVKNIEADPRVRVQLGGRWRSGVAHLLPDDDPRKRMVRLNPANALFIWLAARDHLTIRVDLDPA